MAVHRVKVRYKQSVLGLAWAVLQPLALMAIYTVIFSIVTRVPTGATPYPLMAFAGLLPWLYFSTAIVSSCTSLVTHAQLITKVFFPRELLPVTYIIAALVDFAIATVMLAGMMAWYGIRPGPEALWAIPVLLLETLFVTSLSLFFSAMQVRFRDIGIAMPLLLQIWMFACPVVYPMSAVPARFVPWFALNPLASLIENFRRAVIGTAPLDFRGLSIAGAACIVVLPLAYLYFKRAEATMADVI